MMKMKNLILLPILLMMLSNVLFAAQTGESVSIIQLISNPEKYDGKKVIISGYFNLAFEGTAIYLHKDDCTNFNPKNGLWCVIDGQKYAKFDKHYICMEGIFDAKNKGHMGLWSVTIKDVTRVWLYTKVTTEDKKE